jgi:chromosome segregation ATPase
VRRAAGLAGCWLALLLVAGCNKGPAEEALAAAEQALAAAPEIETYTPEEWRAVSQLLRQARASQAEGRYTDALRTAQALPDRIAAAAQAAARRQQQLAAAWSALSADVKSRIEALRARLAPLEAAEAISSERLTAARADLAALEAAWADATDRYDHGDPLGGLAAGDAVKARAEALACYHRASGCGPGSRR